MVRLINNLVDNAPKRTDGDLFGGGGRTKGLNTGFDPMPEADLRRALDLVPKHTYLEHPYPGIERPARGELRIMRELTNPVHGAFFADVSVSHSDPRTRADAFEIIVKLPWWLRQMIGGAHLDTVPEIQASLQNFRIIDSLSFSREDGFTQTWLRLHTTLGEVNMKFLDGLDERDGDLLRDLWVFGFDNLRHLLRHSPFYSPGFDPEA